MDLVSWLRGKRKIAFSGILRTQVGVLLRVAQNGIWTPGEVGT